MAVVAFEAWRTLLPVSRVVIVALALAGCRSDTRGVALSLRTWAASEGVGVLATACGVTESALSGDAAGAMGAYTRVLDVELAGDAEFTSRLRILVRYGVAPDPVRVESFDAEVHGSATRIPRVEGTTPHLVPLPTFDGWGLDVKAVTRCSPTSTGVWSFIEGIFAAA